MQVKGSGNLLGVSFINPNPTDFSFFKKKKESAKALSHELENFMSSVNTQSDKNVMHELLKRTYIIRPVFQLGLTHFFRKFIFRYLKNIYLFNKIPFLEYLVLVDVTRWFYRTSLKLLCRSRVKL